MTKIRVCCRFSRRSRRSRETPARPIDEGTGFAFTESRDMLLQQANELTVRRVLTVCCVGETLNQQNGAALSGCRCVCVPYTAEGFNMPCLEAAACGTVVICTQGGPTDHFTRPEFTLQVQSTMQSVPRCLGGTPGTIAARIMNICSIR